MRLKLIVLLTRMPARMSIPPTVVNIGLAGMDALLSASSNAFSRFGYSDTDHNTAGWRLAQSAPVNVAFSPKFHITRDDAIFTMGSCFARNVEASLIQAGMNILLSDFDFPVELFDQQHGRIAMWKDTDRHGHLIRSVLNKYTPSSMLNEFQRVFSLDVRRDPFGGLIQIGPDLWYNPQIQNSRIMDLHEALMARDLVDDATARVKRASAIFLTLGFTETWLDSETGTILNMAPRPKFIKRWPDRFRFFNATHQEVLASLEGMYDLVNSVRPDIKFVITVSPVPLGTTFTEMDVITANTYSKSTLRSAAGEFCARHANTDYFPSYEMVMSTCPELAWETDKIHVQQELVDAIIGRFVRGYIGDVTVAGASAAAVQY